MGSAVGVPLAINVYIMMYAYSIGLTADSIGSIYYTIGYSNPFVQRLTPGVSNASVIVDGSSSLLNSLYSFQGCRLDVNGSLYTAAAGMIIKFDLLLNTC